MINFWFIPIYLLLAAAICYCIAQAILHFVIDLPNDPSTTQLEIQKWWNNK